MVFTFLEPVFLTIGPLEFHYYGLMYVLGFMFAYFTLPIIFRIRNIQINAEQFENLFFYTILGGVLGGRIFFVLFYNLSYYLENPLKIFAVWEGGMASHGGFIGAFIAVWLISKHYKLSFWKITDSLVIPAGIGLALGRFGNFINAELFGSITNMPWCMEFEKQEGCRHPTQLYAVGKDLLLFTVLWKLRATQWKDGMLSLVFFSIYAVFRFIVEFFKDSSVVGWTYLHFTEAQWISFAMLIICVVLWKYLKKVEN